jgi:flagellar basal-body rod protein FlgC
MALFNVFDIAGSSMSAQSVRLNTTASNLANATNVAGDAESAYKGRHALFETIMTGLNGETAGGGVAVRQILESQAPPQRVHQPGHPLADAEGFVYLSNVNVMDEMVDMIAASRAYQNSVEVLNTSKQLMLRTIAVGQ